MPYSTDQIDHHARLAEEAAVRAIQLPPGEEQDAFDRESRHHFVRVLHLMDDGKLEL